jgi:hypothetical protein
MFIVTIAGKARDAEVVTMRLSDMSLNLSSALPPKRERRDNISG